ncbi:M15 family metallopeptidase [Acinetobacter bereziniae]
MKQAAKELGIEIEWGGDWKKFKDGPHWQLPLGNK